MLRKSKSESLLTNSISTDKYQQNEDLKKHINNLHKTINTLECSIIQSNENDRQLLMVTQRHNLKNQKLSYQLDEARNENKLLLNALQLNKDNDKDPSKSRTQVDFTSYSTVSLVHLQYKYEELSSSHEGLLKLLDSKEKECRKCYRENEELRDEIQNLKLQISGNLRTIKTLCDKYMKLKVRKDLKISSLRYERDTLKMVHNRLVNLLNQKY